MEGRAEEDQEVEGEEERGEEEEGGEVVVGKVEATLEVVKKADRSRATHKHKKYLF